LDALVCAGQAARIGKGLTVATEQPRVMPDVPAAPPPAPRRSRPQLIRDAILAFLGEPRQAQEVAAHIGRPVSNATGHLAAMRRRGLVVRTGHGRYERASRCPARCGRRPRPSSGCPPKPRRDPGMWTPTQPRRTPAAAASWRGT